MRSPKEYKQIEKERDHYHILRLKRKQMSEMGGRRERREPGRPVK